MIACLIGIVISFFMKRRRSRSRNLAIHIPCAAIVLDRIEHHIRIHTFTEKKWNCILDMSCVLIGILKIGESGIICRRKMS